MHRKSCAQFLEVKRDWYLRLNTTIPLRSGFTQTEGTLSLMWWDSVITAFKHPEPHVVFPPRSSFSPRLPAFMFQKARTRRQKCIRAGFYFVDHWLWEMNGKGPEIQVCACNPEGTKCLQMKGVLLLISPSSPVSDEQRFSHQYHDQCFQFECPVVVHIVFQRIFDTGVDDILGESVNWTWQTRGSSLCCYGPQLFSTLISLVRQSHLFSWNGKLLKINLRFKCRFNRSNQFSHCGDIYVWREEKNVTCPQIWKSTFYGLHCGSFQHSTYREPCRPEHDILPNVLLLRSYNNMIKPGNMGPYNNK